MMGSIHDPHGDLAQRSWLCRFFRADGPVGLVLPDHFRLQGNSLIWQLRFRRTEQVSPDPWPQPGWMVVVPLPGSTVQIETLARLSFRPSRGDA
jgi:hypothetical protein